MTLDAIELDTSTEDIKTEGINKTAADILGSAKVKMQNILTGLTKLEGNLSTLKGDLSEGKKPTKTISYFQEKLQYLMGVNKKRIDLYLINHAKMTLDDTEVMEIIGEYKKWHELKDEVTEVQKLILSAIVMEKQIIKTLGEVIDIMGQMEDPNDN